jgi:hypothetical protein
MLGRAQKGLSRDAIEPDDAPTPPGGGRRAAASGARGARSSPLRGRGPLQFRSEIPECPSRFTIGTAPRCIRNPCAPLSGSPSPLHQVRGVPWGRSSTQLPRARGRGTEGVEDRESRESHATSSNQGVPPRLDRDRRARGRRVNFEDGAGWSRSPIARSRIRGVPLPGAAKSSETARLCYYARGRQAAATRPSPFVAAGTC